VAKRNAHPKAINENGLKTFMPGRKIIKIPINPNVIALHLLQPTDSFNMKTDKAVTIKGPTANIAEV
jgi:hypothetical protein